MMVLKLQASDGLELNGRFVVKVHLQASISVLVS